MDCGLLSMVALDNPFFGGMRLSVTEDSCFRPGGRDASGQHGGATRLVLVMCVTEQELLVIQHSDGIWPSYSSCLVKEVIFSSWFTRGY